jgi:hypothetical protein
MTAMRLEETYGTWWHADDDATLRAGYGRVPTTELAARLGRGVDATRQRARTLGLARPVRMRITWTAAADATLRAEYRRLPTPELAARLGTTVDAVWARAKELKLTRPGRNLPWTAGEDAQVRELYGAVPLLELAARLGRTHDSLSHRLVTLGLTREVAVANRQARDQAEIARLRAEIDHLRHGALDAAHAPTADARRLATLFAYRLSVIDAETAATVLGVPVARLPVEVGKAAALGLDVAREALGEA